MATLNTSTSPKQNPREERKVAGILFLAILAAIVAAFAVYMVASNSTQRLNPYESNRAGSTAPDVNTEAPGDRSGAVAAPQSEKVPQPASKPAPGQ
jgi:hypothetical protein